MTGQCKYPKAAVLLVEDEVDLLELYAAHLEGVAGSIDKATNGQQALELVKAKHYDCIVSDISMPKMTGLELLEAVRKLQRSVPFIILTAFWDKANAIRALRAGAFDFIEKPVKRETYVGVVGTAIEVGLSLRTLDKNAQKLFKGLDKLSDGVEWKALVHQRYANTHLPKGVKK